MIDDGSKDHTAEVVRTVFADDARVRLITIPNGGKANALNRRSRRCPGRGRGGAGCRYPVSNNHHPRLVRWFTDPAIGAVAGNAKVGNRINMITRWQALEYIVAQNLERRALAGAGYPDRGAGRGGRLAARCVARRLAASRRYACRRPGPHHRHPARGYRVQFDPTAIAWTEAPDTVSGLPSSVSAGPMARCNACGSIADHLQSALRLARPGGAAAGLAVPILLTASRALRRLLLSGSLILSAIINYAHHASTYTATFRMVGFIIVLFILSIWPRRSASHGTRRTPAVVLAAAAALRLSPIDVLHRHQSGACRPVRSARRLEQARAEIDRERGGLGRCPYYNYGY